MSFFSCYISVKYSTSTKNFLIKEKFDSQKETSSSMKSKFGEYM